VVLAFAGRRPSRAAGTGTLARTGPIRPGDRGPPAAKDGLARRMVPDYGAAVTMVGSDVVDGAEPPPNTLAWFTTGDVAPGSTFTVTVMGG